jgi:hypothetical protein
VIEYIDQVLKTRQHDRLNVERRMSESADSKQQTVKTSDVARLMELFQSSLLKYREYQPVSNSRRECSFGPSGGSRKQGRSQDSTDSGRTKVDDSASIKSKRWGLWGKRRRASRDEAGERDSQETRVEKEKVNEKEKHVKKMPVCDKFENVLRIKLRFSGHFL